MVSHPLLKILTASAILKAVTTIARHPVAKYHKLEFVDYREGQATVKAVFSGARSSSRYEIHSILGAT